MNISKWIFTILIVSLLKPQISIGVSDLSKEFLDFAKKDEVFDWMVGIRRKIHENPELGYEEFETSKVIREELDKLGISYKHPIAGTGVVGFIGSGEPPFVGLRADMDALSMQEMVEWNHKSKVPGKMHACGHDGHVTMLLGAAKILKKHSHLLKGTVVLVFQPAEEGGGGAKQVVDSGSLENVKAIFGLHVSPGHPVGQVFSRSGAILAGSGSFEAIITGKGGHAAIPQHSIDPILAASNVVVSLQHLVVLSMLSRIPSPLAEPLELFLKEVSRNSGNVIIAQATVHRCNATVEFSTKAKPFFPATINDKGLHGHFQKVAGDVLGVENVKEMPPFMGAEDFSFYQEVMPGYFYFIGMKNEKNGNPASLHSPFFELNEDVLPYGAAMQSALAVTYNHDHNT
ncbi:Amidohydrolase [Cynara cardunculus var. scolymus]|uniref:Amidohydrolase n=1 Tax=Cynara cardunculus var. scolymus TaxID=59895 RepID=A0A103XW52_CYNCS|nr:Amidohydrolase [Cynara cardunculus var. scolymus]